MEAHLEDHPEGEEGLLEEEVDQEEGHLEEEEDRGGVHLEEEAAHLEEGVRQGAVEENDIQH